MSLPRGRPFPPGNKAGRGRPPGSRNKATAQLDALIQNYLEPIGRTLVAGALKGDAAVMRLVLARMPVCRSAPVKLGRLPTGTAVEVSKSSETVMEKVASGKLTIPEGEGVLNLLEARRKAIQTEELEKRICVLESKS